MDLEAKLDRWVADGLISTEQATAIREAEADREPRRRVPLAAQALGYLGGSLALVAALVAVSGFWGDLEDWAKVALATTATSVFFLSGLWTKRVDEPAIQRLTSFLWFLSAAGVAFAVALVGVEWTDAAPEETMLVAAVATMVYASVLWRLLPAALQQLAVVAGLAVATIGGLLQLEPAPERFFGLALWGIGVAWVILAWGGLTPPTWTGYGLGAVLILVGSQAFSFDEMRSWGLALGLVSAIGLIAASVPLAQGILLGSGAAGVFLFVPQAMFDYLEETLGGALALFLAGVVLVISGIVLARLRSSVSPGRR